MKLLISGYGGSTGDTAFLYNNISENSEWVSEIPSLSFMCVDNNTKTLFGVEEKKKNAAFHLFTSNGEHSSVKLNTSWLCHVSFSPKHRLLIGSSYGSGELFFQNILDGTFQGEPKVIAQTLSSNLPNDKLSRTHCAVLSSCEDYIYSANIGLDCIFVYKITNSEVKEQGLVKLKSGAGPRHICINGSIMYVTCEYSNEVIMMELETPTSIKVLAHFPTLPDSYNEQNYCSDLCTTQDQQFLLVANRGANLITVYKIGSNGFLKKVSHFSSFGDWPRYIALLNNDTILGICNEHSSYLSLVAFDKETGNLSNEIKRIPFEGVSFVSEYSFD